MRGKNVGGTRAAIQVIRLSDALEQTDIVVYLNVDNLQILSYENTSLILYRNHNIDQFYQLSYEKEDSTKMLSSLNASSIL